MFTTKFLLFIIGCWAPDVRPPEPELSPRELEAQEEGKKFQQAGSLQPKPEDSAQVQNDEPETPQDAQKEEQTDSNPQPKPEKLTKEKKIPEQRYPFSTTTIQEVALLGHGGGQIMLIPTGSDIDILEKQDTRYHIICKDCSPNRPRQAGFISLDSL